MNVNPTADVIATIAETLRRRAVDFDRIADKMRETGDLTYASEAMQEIANLIPSLRADLLVTRPLREFIPRKRE